MPVRYLFEDEIDEYPDDVDGQGPADELAEKRTDTFSRKKIFRTSTPTRKGRSKVWRHWLASDQRRYHIPCPHCQGKQVLRWDQMRWETRIVWELTDAEGVITEASADAAGAVKRDTGELLDVWYECEHCQQKIEEHHKTAMLAGGRWIAADPGIGKPAGFHLPALYSPLGWYSWRTAVKKRLEADKDPTGERLKVWTNTVLGEPYAEASEQLSDHDIKQRAEGYKLKTVPMGGLFLTGAVDVQANRLEVKIKAWGRGEESWLVDYQVIHGDTEAAQPWEVLDEYLQEKFTHECGAQLRVIAAAVDSGYRTQTVYDWCRRRRHRSIFPVKGQSQTGKSVLGRPSKQDVDHRGQVLKGGVEVWPIGTDTAKSKIYARLKITEPGPGCLHFPLGLPDEYFKQLTAERLVSRYHKGYLRTSWEKDASERNEALDLEVYAYAAAIFAGLTRTNWDRLEASIRATAGDLFVAAKDKGAGQQDGQTNTDADAGSGAGPRDGEVKPETDAAAVTPAAPAASPPAPQPRKPNWVTGFGR
jgi:phage terminase large subunit GpA-like protein